MSLNEHALSAGVVRTVRGQLHRESKKQDTKLLAITSLNIIRFSKFFQWPTRQ